MTFLDMEKRVKHIKQGGTMFAKILEGLLTGDKLASWVRHGLTSAAGVLVGYNFASVDQAVNLATAIADIVAKPEVWAAVALYVTGQGGSVVNKKSK
jgi:hypothetical protein